MTPSEAKQRFDHLEAYIKAMTQKHGANNSEGFKISISALLKQKAKYAALISLTPSELLRHEYRERHSRAMGINV